MNEHSTRINNSGRRLRPLLIAEACNPEWTSVPLVGWSQARAIAQLTDAHLVTQIRNRAPLLRAGLKEGRDFTAIDSELVTRPARRIAGLLGGRDGKGWTAIAASTAFYYYYFEHLLWRMFKHRIRAGEFDVVHRLTPLSPAVPSIIAGKCRRAGVPFILGPLNGGVPWPKEFDAARKQEREWLVPLRAAHRLLPGYRNTRRNAAAILIGSRDTWKQMPDRYHSKCIYLPENGIERDRFSLRRQRKAALPLRVIFVGRLVPYKGADMLLEAAAPLIRTGKVHLSILGDGPQMQLLKDLATRENLTQNLDLAGWIDHRLLQERLIASDLFAFPSIREFGGGVVLEAMAVGLPTAVIRYGGPGEIVTDETGYLVDIGSRESIVNGFRRLLTTLSDNPATIDARSAACANYVDENFTWPVKARRIVEIYHQLIHGHSPNLNPVLPSPEPAHA